MPRATIISRKLQMLQALDRRLGAGLVARATPRARALAESAPANAPLPAAAVRRILVIRPGGLGDAVLTLPMLRALGGAFPAARIEVLAERRNAGAFLLGDSGPETLCYDRDPLAAWRHLSRAGYDLVIDTEQYHHLSALVANALRPRWLCGFATLGRGRLHTHSVPHSEDDYEALSFLRLVEAVTGRSMPFDPEQPFIDVGAAAIAWAQLALGPAGEQRIAAVMPGAGGAYRVWPAERYAEIARALGARGLRVVVLGGADCTAAARRIVAAGSGVLDLTGRTTLAQTAAVLRRCSLSLSADTGVLHVACGVGTPTVALFGPGLHRKWAPPGRRHRVVRLGLPCSPCTRAGRVPPCPIGVACMRDLGVDKVVEALDSTL